MKRCPTCERTFTDDTQKFCANDGTPLVNDEPAFDPEATVMSLGSKLSEESSSPTPSQPPYYNPGAGTPSQPDQNIHQSAPPPSPTPGAIPTWQPPQQPQQQQPYYPQPGMPGGQPPPQQWQGGQQQPPWMPPGQAPQPQGQNWGAGGYYPQQPGQLAPTAGKSLALSLVTLITGILSFVNWALVFAMYNRIIPPDRSVAEIVVYVMLIFGILAVLLGVATLLSSRWRSKALAIVGVVLGLPGIIFFIYLASEGRLP
jgi:uncharacterized membrane protein